MATEFLREKINTLSNMIQAEALQMFQHQMQVDIMSKSTGDVAVDSQLAGQASNSKAQILAHSRRLGVYRSKHAELTSELEAQTAAPAA